MSWNQPICEDCWLRRIGLRKPVRLRDRLLEAETCAFCGRLTIFGVYLRVDPRRVPFPAIESEQS